MGAPDSKCLWNWKFGIWIMEMKLFYMNYTNFPIGSQTRWLQFYYQKYIELEEYMFMPPCGFAYKV
jgi:hypothetical protein